MTLKLGLLGANIARSRMPRLQQYLANLADVAMDYVLLDTHELPPLSPREHIRLARDKGFVGLNITHPFKQDIYPLVKSPCIQGHEQIGSYNTLLLDKEDIRGANTDYSGFKKAYEKIMGREEPGRVLLCGAGGVGRAVASGLGDKGCRELLVHDTSRAQAQSLVTLLESRQVSARIVEHDELPDAIKSADGLVNCTAVGMNNSTESVIDPGYINTQRWAFDAVYTPLNTAFLGNCRNAGLECISGFDLWIFQGLDAFRLFTEVEIEASDALLKETSSWLN